MCKGESLTIKSTAFSHIEDDTLMKAVKFILSEDNCISTSYGSNKEEGTIIRY